MANIPSSENMPYAFYLASVLGTTQDQVMRTSISGETLEQMEEETNLGMGDDQYTRTYEDVLADDPLAYGKAIEQHEYYNMLHTQNEALGASPEEAADLALANIEDVNTSLGMGLSLEDYIIVIEEFPALTQMNSSQSLDEQIQEGSSLFSKASEQSLKNLLSNPDIDPEQITEAILDNAQSSPILSFLEDEFHETLGPDSLFGWQPDWMEGALDTAGTWINNIVDDVGLFIGYQNILQNMYEVGDIQGAMEYQGKIDAIESEQERQQRSREQRVSFNREYKDIGADYLIDQMRKMYIYGDSPEERAEERWMSEYGPSSRPFVDRELMRAFEAWLDHPSTANVVTPDDLNLLRDAHNDQVTLSNARKEEFDQWMSENTDAMWIPSSNLGSVFQTQEEKEASYQATISKTDPFTAETAASTKLTPTMLGKEATLGEIYGTRPTTFFDPAIETAREEEERAREFSPYGMGDTTGGVIGPSIGTGGISDVLTDDFGMPLSRGDYWARLAGGVPGGAMRERREQLDQMEEEARLLYDVMMPGFDPESPDPEMADLRNFQDFARSYLNNRTAWQGSEQFRNDATELLNYISEAQEMTTAEISGEDSEKLLRWRTSFLENPEQIADLVGMLMTSTDEDLFIRNALSDEIATSMYDHLAMGGNYGDFIDRYLGTGTDRTQRPTQSYSQARTPGTTSAFGDPVPSAPPSQTPSPQTYPTSPVIDDDPYGAELQEVTGPTELPPMDYSQIAGAGRATEYQPVDTTPPIPSAPTYTAEHQDIIQQAKQHTTVAEGYMVDQDTGEIVPVPEGWVPEDRAFKPVEPTKYGYPSEPQDEPDLLTPEEIAENKRIGKYRPPTKEEQAVMNLDVYGEDKFMEIQDTVNKFLAGGGSEKMVSDIQKTLDAYIPPDKRKKQVFPVKEQQKKQKQYQAFKSWAQQDPYDL
jgi:hypothetical protein